MAWGRGYYIVVNESTSVKKQNTIIPCGQSLDGMMTITNFDRENSAHLSSTHIKSQTKDEDLILQELNVRSRVFSKEAMAVMRILNVSHPNTAFLDVKTNVYNSLKVFPVI